MVVKKGSTSYMLTPEIRTPKRLRKESGLGLKASMGYIMSRRLA